MQHTGHTPSLSVLPPAIDAFGQRQANTGSNHQVYEESCADPVFTWLNGIFVFMFNVTQPEVSATADHPHLVKVWRKAQT